MKEMVYSEHYKREVLDTGTCYGFTYYILSLGTHPTAYIKLPPSHPCYDKAYDEIPIDVHCGLTFKNDFLFIDDTRDVPGMFIGWDYAHVGDYYGGRFQNDVRDKKWTTKEIQDEVRYACEQLDEIYINEVMRYENNKKKSV